MKQYFHTPRTGFVRDEGGAITVDWIVLTAALVMMGMAAAFLVGTNVPVLANKVGDHMANTDVNPYD